MPVVTTLAALLLAAALGPACAPSAIRGLTRLETAQSYLDAERFGRAANMAEYLLEEAQSPPLSAQDEAEAAWLAGESRMFEGEHERAFQHYKRLLETAPWSPHVAALEARLYEIGLALLYEDQYGGWLFSSRGRGVEVMTTLQVHFRQSARADDALRHIADWFASDENEEWLEASLTYEQLFTDYPDSEWAERSLWLAAWCRLKRVYRAGYNNGDLHHAHELLRTSRRVHPRGAASREVREDLTRTRDLLAQTEVIVADFYAGRGRPAGEQLRLANAALLYPETDAGEAARQRLAAMGLDIDVMAADPALSSTDGSVSPRSPWEQDAQP